MSLALQLMHLDDESLLWRTLLLNDVVGKDWVRNGNEWEMKKILEGLRLDAVVLGLSLPKLLSKWLDGTYINVELDTIHNWVVNGIDWLISGDLSYISHVSEERLKEVSDVIEKSMKGYLEELYINS